MANNYLAFPALQLQSFVTGGQELKYMAVYMAAYRGHIRAKRIPRPAGMTRGRKLIAFHVGDVEKWLENEQAHKAGPKPRRGNGKRAPK